MQTTVHFTFATPAIAQAFLASLPAATTAGVTPTAGNAAAPGKPAAETRYFFNSKDDTIFELKAGDKAPSGSGGSTNITLQEYEGHKTRLAAKYKALQTGAASGAATAATSTTAIADAEFDPFADETTSAVSEVDEPTLMAKLVELSKFVPEGRTLLQSMLERAQVKGVPALLKGKTGVERATLFVEAKKHMGQA
jgi:hypothetical protein